MSESRVVSIYPEKRLARILLWAGRRRVAATSDDYDLDDSDDFSLYSRPRLLREGKIWFARRVCAVLGGSALVCGSLYSCNEAQDRAREAQIEIERAHFQARVNTCLQVLIDVGYLTPESPPEIKEQNLWYCQELAGLAFPAK